MENNGLEMQELIREIKEKKFTWELFGKTTVGGSSVYNLTQLEITSLSKLQNILINEILNYKKNFINENCTFIFLAKFSSRNCKPLIETFFACHTCSFFVFVFILVINFYFPM